MGCDFQISGSLADASMRKRCLAFLDAFDAMMPGVYPASAGNFARAALMPITRRRDSQQLTCFSDPVYAALPITRMNRYAVFNKPDKITAAYESCAESAKWSPACFEGVVFSGMPIIFDSAAGGVMCSLHRVPSQNADGEPVNDWNYPEWLENADKRGACEEIRAYPACHIRFDAGEPEYFIYHGHDPETALHSRADNH